MKHVSLLAFSCSCTGLSFFRIPFGGVCGGGLAIQFAGENQFVPAAARACCRSRCHCHCHCLLPFVLPLLLPLLAATVCCHCLLPFLMPLLLPFLMPVLAAVLDATVVQVFFLNTTFKWRCLPLSLLPVFSSRNYCQLQNVDRNIFLRNFSTFNTFGQTLAIFANVGISWAGLANSSANLCVLKLNVSNY